MPPTAYYCYNANLQEQKKPNRWTLEQEHSPSFLKTIEKIQDEYYYIQKLREVNSFP